MSHSPPDDFAALTPASEKLSFPTKLAYGAGDMGAAITANIGVFYTAYFLTDVAGLNPGLAAWVLLIGKVWDAINDPVVGVLSDKTRSRLGRRLPWMLYGAIPFGITFFLSWIVPGFGSDNATNQWGLFWYYVIISILFNSFYTAVNLPYTALTPELTQDYDERTNLNSFRFAFSIGGSILSIVVVLIINGLPIDRIQQYLLIGAVCAVMSVLPLYWCVWGTRSRVLAVATQHPEIEPSVSVPLAEQLRIVRNNVLYFIRKHLPFWLAAQLIAAIISYFVVPWMQLPDSIVANVRPSIHGIALLISFVWSVHIVLNNLPFLYVIGIYLCSWLGVQLTAAIIPYFVASWMRLPDSVTAGVIFAVQGTALVMLFVWSALSERVGKKGVYFMGMGVWIIAQAGLFFLQPEQVPLMYVLAVMAGVGVSTAYLIPWSMLPDVIELDELRTGQRREGIFYSFIVLLQKVCLAIAVFLVLKSLDWAGYVKALPENLTPIQPDAVLFAIRFSIGPLPTLALICGLVLTYFYPLTREVHAEILLKLKERQNRD